MKIKGYTRADKMSGKHLWFHNLMYAKALDYCRANNPMLADFLEFFTNEFAINRTKVKSAHLGYLRFLEYPRAMERLDLKPGATVLDIGSSYRPFPVWMLKKGGVIYPTEIPQVAKELEMYWDHAFVRENKNRFRPELQDGRQLTYPDNHFDRVTCISVVEHIENEYEVLREMGRVLKPGGKALLTFPIGSRGQIPPGTPYGRNNLRCYSSKLIEERLVKPSGLEMLSLDCFESVKKIPEPNYQHYLWLGAMRTTRHYKRVETPEHLGEPYPLDTGVLVMTKK